MGIKRDKLDKVFSDCVRERYNWKCCRCDKYYQEGAARRGLHCSHIFSRRHKLTRWMPENAVSHCYNCHRYLGENPVLFNRWARDFLGEYVVDMLEERHHQIYKITKAEREEIYAHLKSEYARMKRERAAGETGVLEFVGFL